MQTLEWRTVDKSAWDDGEWQSEPDKKQWRDAATGLPCLIVRNPGGALCGYVGVSEGHPLHGRDYYDPDVDVHGGLTFAGACANTDDESRHICHLPEPGEPVHVWWFGFDCAHSGDRSPAYEALPGFPRFREPYDRYRTVSYVEREVARLAAQLAQGIVTEGQDPQGLGEAVGRVEPDGNADAPRLSLEGRTDG